MGMWPCLTIKIFYQLSSTRPVTGYLQLMILTNTGDPENFIHFFINFIHSKIPQIVEIHIDQLFSILHKE